MKQHRKNIICLAILALICVGVILSVTACGSLAPKGNCFGPPTQTQQDAHASFTTKLSLP